MELVRVMPSAYQFAMVKKEVSQNAKFLIYSQRTLGNNKKDEIEIQVKRFSSAGWLGTPLEIG